MGIEKFFNTLKSSYKSKLITEYNPTNKISSNILFFDVNIFNKKFLIIKIMYLLIKYIKLI
jgi:hypothetical protein